MAGTMQESKKILRQRVKSILSKISPEDKLSQSSRVAQKVIQHPKYVSGHRIGIYLSLPDEIQTDSILKDIFKTEKMCFIPKYDSENMSMVQMKNDDECFTLPKTKWNIPQPSEEDYREEALETGGLDVLIVPGRAYTRTGCRLGRGKGYYDKYLSRYKNNGNARLPYLIGLAFKEQIFDSIPTSDMDYRLDEIIYDCEYS